MDILQYQAYIQENQRQIYPDEHGRFGTFGGRFMPEGLMTTLAELEAAYEQASNDATFQATLQRELQDYVGRPTALSFVPRFSAHVAPDVKVYLKREDLAHSGAYTINNALGQGLLAQWMKKNASSPLQPPVNMVSRLPQSVPN